MINATPQKRHLAYKNPQKRREENASLLSGVVKCLLLLGTMQQKKAQLSLRLRVGIYCFVYQLEAVCEPQTKHLTYLQCSYGFPRRIGYLLVVIVNQGELSPCC